MEIQIVREDEVKLSVYSAETPLEEVMEDVYNDSRRGVKRVTAVQRVDLAGRVHERLTAAQYAARIEARGK